MSARRGPGGAAADIARQARELLVSVRESRWTGFAPQPQPARSAPLPRRAPAAARVPAPAAVVRAATAAPQEAIPWTSLEQIAQAVGACRKCPLHATRKNTVPGEGNPRARLMFVGEAPGADEDAQGRPFVGAAGKLLERMIGAMGLERGEVFIANVLKCRPPGNRDPQPHEVGACLPYLRAQIALIRPEVICSLGRHATHALLERSDALGSLRGRFFDLRGTPLLPTYHPSYLLRTPADKGAAWKDLQTVMARLGLPLPERTGSGGEA